jgi:nucleoside-diphosphate-sugar epimerase
VRKARAPGNELELLGDAPGSIKHFTHVSDTVRAAIHFVDVEWPLAGQLFVGPINICNDNQLSVEEVAQLVLEELGIKKSLRWLGAGANWAGDNPVVRINNRRAKSAGWRPQFGLSENALRQAIKEML